MRCLIVDDESPARLEMRRLLADFPEIEIAGEAENVEAALALSRQMKPDVIFLDIKLRRETGFDLVGRLPEPLPHIVFVTAYDSYAVRGFECNALDYLLKPVEPERLADTIRRLARSERIPPRNQESDSVFLRDGATAHFVPWREIHHILAEGNYTRVFLEDGTSVTLIRSLRQWIDIAPLALFVQVHRKALVRLDAIRQVISPSKDRHELVLSDGTRVEVGRTHWNGLKALLPFL